MRFFGRLRLDQVALAQLRLCVGRGGHDWLVSAGDAHCAVFDLGGMVFRPLITRTQPKNFAAPFVWPARGGLARARCHWPDLENLCRFGNERGHWTGHLGRGAGLGDCLSGDGVPCGRALYRDPAKSLRSKNQKLRMKRLKRLR